MHSHIPSLLVPWNVRKSPFFVCPVSVSYLDHFGAQDLEMDFLQVMFLKVIFHFHIPILTEVSNRRQDAEILPVSSFGSICWGNRCRNFLIIESFSYKLQAVK